MTPRNSSRLCTLLLLITFCLGFAIVLYAKWFIWNGKLSGLELITGNPAWNFGKREWIHFSGLFGCILFGWTFLHSFSYKKMLKIHIGMALLAGLCILAIDQGPEWLFEWIGSDGLTYTQLLVSYIVSVPVLYAMRWSTPRFFEPKAALNLSVLYMLSLSVLWEVIMQPCFSTYDEPAKGYIQYAQILSDWSGILLGYAVSRLCIWGVNTIRAKAEAGGISPD